VDLDASQAAGRAGGDGCRGSFEILVATCVARRDGSAIRIGVVDARIAEPWRLIPRYVRDFVGLGRRFPWRWWRPGRSGPILAGRRDLVDTAEAMHVYVQGKLTLEATPALEQAVR